MISVDKGKVHIGGVDNVATLLAELEIAIISVSDLLVGEYEIDRQEVAKAIDHTIKDALRRLNEAEWKGALDEVTDDEQSEEKTTGQSC